MSKNYSRIFNGLAEVLVRATLVAVTGFVAGAVVVVIAVALIEVGK
jgi:hypothetical protein